MIRSFIKEGEPLGALRLEAVAYVVGSTALFGLLLIPAGLIIALARADPDQRRRQPLLQVRLEGGRGAGRPRGVLRAGVRQGPRRADAAARHLVRRLTGDDTMELLGNLWLGAQTAMSLWQSLLLPDRRLPRHRDRRAAGPRAGGDDRHAAADHLRAAAGVGADHAVGHLLRRAVRRLDHGDPGQPAGRELVGGDGTGRLPDGAAGPRRPGAGDRRHRLVLRRHRVHVPDRAVRAAAGGSRAEVRARPSTSR